MAKTVTVHPLSVSGHVKQARRASKRRAVTYGVDNPAPGVRVDPVPMEGLRTIRQYAVTHQADGTPIEKGMAKMDVLRMSVRKQFVGGGGNHLPCIIVKKHSNGYGPCSRRQSKGKHKKSGSARSTRVTPHGRVGQANLCHQLGVSVNVGHQVESQALRQALATLKKRHMRMLDERFSVDRYQHNRDSLLRQHPHLRQAVEHFEREHVRSFA